MRFKDKNWKCQRCLLEDSDQWHVSGLNSKGGKWLPISSVSIFALYWFHVHRNILSDVKWPVLPPPPWRSNSVPIFASLLVLPLMPQIVNFWLRSYLFTITGHEWKDWCCWRKNLMCQHLSFTIIGTIRVKTVKPTLRQLVEPRILTYESLEEPSRVAEQNLMRSAWRSGPRVMQRH